MPNHEAIQLIHKYNGIACLAHPWYDWLINSFILLYKQLPALIRMELVRNRLTKDPEAVTKYFVEIGVDGMECFPPKHHQDENSGYFYDFAKKHNLYVTSGSDYHGSKDPEVLPGDNIYNEEEWERTSNLFKEKNIL